MFAQGFERIHGATVHQTEITRINGNVYAAYKINDAVKSVGGQFLEPGFTTAAQALAVYDISAFFVPDFDQVFDQFGRVLQIGIENDDGVTFCEIEPRRHGRLFAEVA